MLAALRRDARWAAGVAVWFVVAAAGSFALSEVAPHAAAAVAGWTFLPLVLIVTLGWGRLAGIGAALLAALLIPVFAVHPLLRPAANDANDYAVVAASATGLAVTALLVAYLNARLVQAESQRVAASERLQAQQRFQALIEHSADGIQLFSREGKRLYVSPSTTAVIGYTPDELDQRDIFSSVEPEDRTAAGRNFGRVGREPGLSQTVELRVRHKDGTWRWVECTTTNLLEEPAVRAMVVNFRDVTARHDIQEEVRRSRDELAAILAGVADGITVQNADGRLLYANTAAARLIGYASVEALLTAPLGEMLERFTVLDEAGSPFPLDQLPGRRILRGEEVAEQVFRYRQKDTGEERWSVVRAVPVRDAAGRAQLAVTAFQDISELKRALAAAQEALATRDRFLAIASHELRTPLTTLKGQLELLRRRLARETSREQLDQSLGQALAQANRLNQLVDRVLDVSRLAGGLLTVNPAPLELVALVSRVVAEEGAAAPVRRIDCSLPDGDVWLEADALRLEQTLVNLLQNARKYSAEDTAIEIRLEAAPDTVSIAVQDHGIGVPAEDEERIFAPFQRGGNVDRGISGLGLGLSIARDVVRAHGGTLTLDSIAGQGATFTITLPRKPEQAGEGGEPA